MIYEYTYINKLKIKYFFLINIMGSVYDLHTINNNSMKELIFNNNNINDTLKLKYIEWKDSNCDSSNKNQYYILKYNKNYLTEDNIYSIGLLRSIIIKNNEIIAYSPPKL